MAVTQARQGWVQRALTTIVENWLTVGRDPKIRDPQNSSHHSGGNAAGVRVNDTTAMRLSAFWACVRLIASTIGSLPFPVYWVDENGVRRSARDTTLHKVLHESPNA